MMRAVVCTSPSPYQSEWSVSEPLRIWMDRAPIAISAAKARIFGGRVLFLTTQIAEATKTIPAITHQLAGRHAELPSTMPTEKDSAAQKSGCLSESWFLPRALNVALRTRRT